QRKHRLYVLAGLVTIWVALETPIDTISDHYLDSVHMLQHVLLGFVAPPLMLLSLSPGMVARIVRIPGVRPLAEPVPAQVIAAADRWVHRRDRPDHRWSRPDDLRQGDDGRGRAHHLLPLVWRRAPLRPRDRIAPRGAVIEVQRQHPRPRRAHPSGAPAQGHRR